jgi:NitT/TauT family transport system substrate-binding protein
MSAGIANQGNQWQRIKELMRERTTTTVGLGWFGASRMASDYALVRIYLSPE